MSLKKDFEEWNNNKKKAREKMIECPWCGHQDGYKTWAAMNCFRCNGKIDKDGNPDRT